MSDDDEGAQDGIDEESDLGWETMTGKHRGIDEAAADPAASASAAAAELEALHNAERVALMEDMFVQALVCRKAMLALRDVQRLSFSWWQAAAAVQRFGGDLASGVAWLLERGHAGVEDMAVMPLMSGAERGGWPDMDLKEELQSLAEVQSSLGVSTDQVQTAVVEAVGDVPRAVEVLLGRARGGPHAVSRSNGIGSAWYGSVDRLPWGGGGGGSLLLQSDPVLDGPQAFSASAGVPSRGLIGASSSQDTDEAGGPSTAGPGVASLSSWAVSSSGQGVDKGLRGLSGRWPQQQQQQQGPDGNASSLFGGFVQQDTAGSDGGSSRFSGLWGAGR